MKLFYYAAAAAAMASAVFCSCDKQDEVTPPQPEIAPVQFVGVTALDVVTRAEAKPYAAECFYSRRYCCNETGEI